MQFVIRQFNAICIYQIKPKGIYANQACLPPILVFWIFPETLWFLFFEVLDKGAGRMEPPAHAGEKLPASWMLECIKYNIKSV